jgi:hypothetical protein
MSELRVEVTASPPVHVEVEEPPGVTAPVELTPPPEVIEVLIPGPAGPPGEDFEIDATGLRVERDTHDGEPRGFTFLATDEGLLYIKEEDGWSEGVPLLAGPQGEPGEAGPQGERGASISVGMGDPSVTARPGDLYVDGDSGNLWVYD